MIKKYKNLIYSFIHIFALSLTNTVKGGIIVECGYNIQYWIAELVSLLLMTSLLYFLYKTINDGKCTTVKREVKDEIHD
jgi:hypothetical protein